MITIIAGTNRANSRTYEVAVIYQQLLQEMGLSADIFSLQEMKSLYRDESFLALEKKYLLDAQKFIVIIPEYNGSIPGIFKLMVDNCDIRKVWYGKEMLITGVADGRAGNLRGLDHLTGIMHYLRVQVYYNKIPLSRINEEMNKEGKLINETTIQTIKVQLQGFLNKQ